MRQTVAMVKIGSPPELQDWLEGKPPQLAAAIASRIALRVLPLALERPATLQDAATRSTARVFRANAISRSARSYPGLKIAAAAAANAAARAAANANARTYAATNVALAARAAARAAAAAVGNVANSTTYSASAAARASDAAADREMLLEALGQDCSLWTGDERSIVAILARPLWPRGAVSPFAREWDEFRNRNDSARLWSNWIAWYERRLKGGRGEWGLPAEAERKMARWLIETDEGIWKAGENDPASLNAEIGAWLDELRPKPRERAARIDFFVSYASPNEAMAREAVRVLDEAGFSTFAMFKDIAPGHNFVTEMNRGLGAAKGLIGLFSQSYFESQHCLAELAFAYNSDPGGSKRFAQALLLEPCKLTPLARQVVYRSLIGLSQSERKAAILDLAPRRRAKRTKEQTADFAQEIVSPKPVLAASGKIAMAPNPAFDTPLAPQDMLDPIRQMLALLRATIPSLRGNMLEFLRNNFTGYDEELGEGRQNSSWGLLDTFMRNAETSFLATSRAEFDAGLTNQIEDIFRLHAKCRVAIKRADERFTALHDIEVDETAAGQAIASPVTGLADAAEALKAGGLTEPSFDRGMDEIVRMGRDQQHPPVPRAEPVSVEAPVPDISQSAEALQDKVTVEAVSGRKAWVIGALGIARETLNLLRSTASLARQELVKQAMGKLAEAIDKLKDLLL